MSALNEISNDQIISNHDGTISDSFEAMGLEDSIVQAIHTNLDLETPSPIQRNVIPPILAGKNITLLAPPASGKTFAFVISVLQLHKAASSSKLVVISPTRDSATEFYSILRALEHMRVGLCIAGRMDIDSQEVKNSDIVVATPRSMNDLLTNKETVFNHGELDDIGVCVVDGVDDIAERGDTGHLLELVEKLPKKTQLVLGSGDMEGECKSLVSKRGGEIVNISVSA